MATEGMGTIEKKLEDARKDLLDLTYRNRLINYRAAPKRSVQVVDEEPRELFDILVLQGKRMQFSPRPKKMDGGDSESQSDQSPEEEILMDDSPMIWTLPDQDAKTPNNHTDLYLQTKLESETLQQRLFYIAQESKSVFEEQGCTILYLATGFLEWTEIPKGEVHKAPLILIPVEIERDQIRTSFKLKWTGEDLITNISLQAKLSEIGVNLPSFEMPEKKDGIELYFKTVADNIRGQENWQVTKEIRLDFFTFSKFMMYKDLDPTAWPVGNSPALHPLIAAIFGDGPSSETGFGGGLPFPEQEVDARLPTRSVYHVLDADSSQIAVIQDLKSGTNLVVEGPPGTGKSQTIANVIAEFLAIGKTVLFVSEKMAALEVVKGRLDSLGLGIFCLELHNSKKANKKKVLGEIQRAIGVRGPTQKDNDEVLQNVEDLRSELNRYTAALSTPVGRLGLTPYQLYGMSESARRLFIANGHQMPVVTLPQADTISPTIWSPAIRTLQELDALVPLVSPIKENPWRFCTPGSFFSNDVEAVSRLLSSALEDLSLIRTNAEQLVEWAGIANPTTQTELVNAIHATEILIASEPIEQSVLVNESWNEPNNEAEGLIQKIETYQAFRASLASRMQESIFVADLASLILEFETSSKKILHSLLGPNNKTWAHNQMPNVSLPPLDSITLPRWFPAIRTLEELDTLLLLVSPIKENPWRFCTPESFSVNDVEEISRLLYSALENLSLIRTSADQLVECAGIASPTTQTELVNAVHATEILIASEPIDKSVLLNASWNEPNNEAEGLIQKIEMYQTHRALLASRMQESVFAADHASLILEFETSSKNFFHSLFGPYKKIRAQIDGYYLTREERSDEALLADLREVQRCYALKKEIQEISSLGQLMFGAHWRGEESSPEHLHAFSGWIVKFRHELLTGVLTPRSVEIVSRGVDSDRIREITITIEGARVRFNSHMADLFGRLSADSTKYFPLNREATHFDDIQTVFESWLTGIDRLVPWTQYVAVRKGVEKSVAAPLVPLVEQGQLQCGEFRACLEANYAMSLLRLVFDQNPTLERFVGHVHNKRIEDFVKLDHRMIRENTLRIARRLCQNRPVLVGGASPSSEIGFLQTELNRKRGHASIRQLLTKAMKPIQQIKPCFMMSPPSIAQFLDPCLIKFDIVIFDEASQVKPAEALGAILRGKQVAVIGDSRQLPPTSFFDKIVAASENEDRDDAMPSDMESILNLCKTRFPNRTLLWHYRSRHDSLITLSNQEFYNNDLYVFPSPMRDGEELGLKFVYLPETVYDRGKSGMNRGEARKVAESVIDHARRYPKKSLGVGTFNIHQQEAILEELERLRGENPDLEEFFGDKGTETFFVKNLEMIQGDERDVIFLSVGFGYDAQHKFSMNFGALNKDGGERRLNVLITRARLRCVVFANFRARELPVADIQSASRGVQVLKLFLEYAETGKVPCTMEPLADCDSPFEESVYAFLTENGYVVHKQVGCKGYRIDLAVVNPEIPGEYLIGVECDGATYHSSRVARDRDRLRQEILEGLGWRITRVWSTDWFRKLGACQKDLKAAIEQAQEAAHEKIVLPGPAPKPDLSAEEADFQAKIESVSGTLTTTAPPDKEMPLAPAYVICDSLKVPKGIDPKDFPPQKMAMLIEQVVKIEGPVYYEEMVRRIRDAFGVKRTGNQIRAAIDAGVGSAVEHWTVKRNGEFLWPWERPASIVRRRGETIKPQIEMICNEELEEAALFVLKWQYATKMEALATEVCHVVGIQKVNGQAKKRAQQVIAGMMSRGIIEAKLNGLIDIPVGQEKSQPVPSLSRWDQIKIN